MSAILQAGLTGLALLLPVCLSRAQTAAATVPEPEVLTLSVATRDAPVVEPVRHGRLRQNAWIDWVLLAAGPTDGRDAAYLFTTVAREENVQGMTPVFSFVDLSNGALTSLYPDTRIRVREHRAALDLDALMTPRDRGASLELEAAPSAMTTSWVWGKAISGARASSNSL